MAAPTAPAMDACLCGIVLSQSGAILLLMVAVVGFVDQEEKLLGKIPGAYNQAFQLDGHMEDDEDLDDEVAEIRERVAVVILSKEVKQRIRASWANSLIVKVYGRTV
nr:hypothetical protein CFP56_35512 [Quercus suber]